MGDYDILMQFDIAADEATVRRLLSTEEGIASWWSTRTSLRETPEGQRLEVSFPDQPQPFEFAVRQDRERIEWATGSYPAWWADTTIGWNLEPVPQDVAGPKAGGTRLHFGHRGFDPGNPVIPVVTPAWAQIILRLVGVAETGDRQPFFDF